MFKYFRQDYETDTYEEITYEKALQIVLGTYKDCDITRDMLTIPNRIRCRFSTITVHKSSEHGDMVLMAGLWNFTPEGVEYDDDGNRIEKGE